MSSVLKLLNSRVSIRFFSNFLFNVFSVSMLSLQSFSDFQLCAGRFIWKIICRIIWSLGWYLHLERIFICSCPMPVECHCRTCLFNIQGLKFPDYCKTWLQFVEVLIYFWFIFTVWGLEINMGSVYYFPSSVALDLDLCLSCSAILQKS